MLCSDSPRPALRRCYLQLLQPLGTSRVLSSDSQSALLQGLLDFSGLLIWERFRLLQCDGFKEVGARGVGVGVGPRGTAERGLIGSGRRRSIWRRRPRAG